MTQDLRAVDALIRRLGALVSARDAANVAAPAQAAIVTAVSEAASAVASATRLEAESAMQLARRQVDMAEEVITTFDRTLAESRRFQAAAFPLCERARILVEEARRLGAGAGAPTQPRRSEAH